MSGPTKDDRPRPSEEPVWREQFPVDTPDDEYRSRRDFTRLVGMTSFAFLVGQFFIVWKSVKKKVRGALPEVDIAGVGEIEIGGAKLFRYPEEHDACVLVRISDADYVAYGQKCTHLSCPVIPQPRDGKFHCPCHEGSFDLFTGEPLSGPPRRALPPVTLAVRGGRIYAVGMGKGSA